MDHARPFERALRVHCYRMLGSSHDSEDMVQETWLRAWRSRETLTDPAMVRPWLYRIATNVCLDELARRPKRQLVLEGQAPMKDPTGPLDPPIGEPVWLEPMPTSWIEGASETDDDPSARYTTREGVGLAFVAALHMLTAIQRATLLLRDVVGLSAEETAAALGVSLGSVNSALFRAREIVATKLGGRETAATAKARADVDEELLGRYVRAFEAARLEELVDVLHADVVSRMPPRPTWVEGRAANLLFYGDMFRRKDVLGLPRLVRTSANGQPAFGYYRSVPLSAPRTLHAVQVVTVRDGLVAAVDHFMTPAVFPIFDLPPTL